MFSQKFLVIALAACAVVSGLNLKQQTKKLVERPRPEQGRPDRDQTRPGRDETKPDRDQSRPDRDQSRPDRDQSRPDRDQSRPDRDQSRPDRDQSRPDGDMDKPDGFMDVPDMASDSMEHFAFDAFKTQFNKVYGSDEEERVRFKNFVANLREADARNIRERKAGGTAKHGVTKFSDLSQAEFESKYLTADVKLKKPDTNVVTYDPPSLTVGLVDWAGVYTTPVKNQGYCGSCWAFSATEQIESDGMRTLGTDFILAPEQMVQCDSTSFGCDGGWTEHAYDYIKKAGGLEQESNYPYTSYLGVTGTCSVNSKDFVVTVDSYTTVNGESSMTSYVQQTGPLSVCLDANNWNSYTGGIMSVCGKQVDHCVQAVGVDASTTNGYWKVRNSWGTDWGEDGYILLAWGKNTCDITNDPTYTVVRSV